MPAPDFVAVGHVTLDRFGEVTRAGGSALYAAVTADRLGLSAGILTRHGDDFPLEQVPPRIEVVSLPAARTTSFEHATDAAGARRLRVLSAAGALTPEDLPADWRDARIVLLAPVLNEVDPLLATVFTGAAIGAGAQGWLRGVAGDGAVIPRPWEPPDFLLGRLQGLFLSREDVRGQEATALEWFQRVPVAALTAGALGALLFVNGERYEVRPRPSHERDETGAGDVFAATFLVRYEAEGDPWLAAEAAACAAGLSVEGEGWSAVPDADALAAALADYRREK
jgi:sugar/nucleoside kinase (ribokinase family)